MLIYLLINLLTFYLLLTCLLTYLVLTYLLLSFLRIYLIMYWLTPYSRVLLQKQTDSQPVNKLPSYYGTRKFIAAFTNARQLSLSWTSSIYSIPRHPTSWRSILILSSHLRPSLPNGQTLTQNRAKILLPRWPDDICLCTPVLCRVQSSSFIARWIQSTFPTPVSSRYTSVLPSHLPVGHSTCFFL